MPFGLICDRFHRHPKRDVVPLEVDGMLMRAISYCAEHLTDGFVPASFVDQQLAKHCTVHGYGVRRAKREREALLDALTRPLPPRDNPILHAIDGGFRVHDYLEVNKSRSQIEGARAGNRRRQSTYKTNHTPTPPDSGNGVTPGIGVGEGTASNEQQEPIDARPRTLSEMCRRVLEILAECPRFTVSDLVTGIQVENAVQAAPRPEEAVIAAAHQAVVWGTDPSWRNTDAGSVFLSALRKQPANGETAGKPRRQSPSDLLRALDGDAA